MGHCKTDHKETKHYYKLCVKKLKACYAKIKKAYIDEAYIEVLKGKNGTLEELKVTGPLNSANVSVAELLIEPIGCITTDYLVVNKNTQMKGKLHLHKYVDPLAAAEANDVNAQVDEDSFDVAEKIDCIVKHLCCIEQYLGICCEDDSEDCECEEE